MDLKELTIYLGAAAASDEPIDGREKDLMRHLLRDFGADHQQAHDLVAALPEPFQLQATLSTLSSREVALDLVRALLVISYCDGCFEEEEGRFLTPLIERFSLTGPELTKAKQQALYFLKLSPPSIRIPQELVQAQNWDAVSELAHEHYQVIRREFYNRFQSELRTADAETCFLAMSVGPPSFDITHTKERFAQAHPDFFHMDEEESISHLRDESERQLRNQWESAYAARCNFCYLEAPGKRRDPCPRCGADYGEAAR